MLTKRLSLKALPKAAITWSGESPANQPLVSVVEPAFHGRAMHGSAILRTAGELTSPAPRVGGDGGLQVGSADGQAIHGEGVGDRSQARHGG